MPDEPEPELSFEQALTQLERIVASLERGEPELTTALANYEKGVQLLKLCQGKIDEAEQSIALLTGVDDTGNPLTAPVDGTSTNSPTISIAPPSTNPIANDPKLKRSEALVFPEPAGLSPPTR